MADAPKVDTKNAFNVLNFVIKVTDENYTRVCNDKHLALTC